MNKEEFKKTQTYKDALEHLQKFIELTSHIGMCSIVRESSAVRFPELHYRHSLGSGENEFTLGELLEEAVKNVKKSKVKRLDND